MKPAICTIVTPDYEPQALALALSLKKSGCDCRCIAFVASSTAERDPAPRTVHGVEFLPLNTVLTEVGIGALLQHKYRRDPDRLRWTFKPVVLLYALRSLDSSHVLYLDPDMFFVQPPEPLFEPLRNGAAIVLTPHWRPSEPAGLSRPFRLNFMDGLFNAGCVGATERGAGALRWWAEACLAGCERDYAAGLYDDQRYLDLMPIYFEDVHICRHQGVNLADWNLHLRKLDANGSRPVPDVWPVTLIHFTQRTVLRIKEGADEVLQPYLATYEERIQEARILLERPECTGV
jgi:hypothetical protein